MEKTYELTKCDIEKIEALLSAVEAVVKPSRYKSRTMADLDMKTRKVRELIEAAVGAE